MIDSAASAPAYSYASPPPVATSADFCAAPAPAIGYMAPSPAVSSISTNPVIESVASTPAVIDTGPAHVSEYVAPSPAVPYATQGSLIKSEASAPAVTDKTSVPVSEYVTSAVGASPAPVTDYASTSSTAAACAAPGKYMNVRDLSAQSDARAAQNLKCEACQATRAPVIEHVITSPAGSYASPTRKAKAKH